LLLPILRDKPLASITPNECRTLVLDIAPRSRFQAKAATRILKTVFTWAIESGRYGIEISPCDRIKFSKLVGTLPHRQRTLTDTELSVSWHAMEKLSGFERDYFRVLLMTGQRRGEVSGMRCREIDWSRALWTIPEERYKTGETHIVPLSDELIEILQKRPCGTGENDCLFSADGTGAAPLQGFHHAITRLRKEMRKLDPQVATDWVVHDLRRSMRTRLASFGIPDTVCEYVIGHRPRGMQGIYNQHRYEKEIRAALLKWQQHLHRITQGKTARVVPMIRAK
jgi:integrase